MTSTEAGFLADIIERPDDDVPRLIYADWLEDGDTPDGRLRAALIRQQCRTGKAIWIDRREGEPDSLAADITTVPTAGALCRLLGVPGCHRGVKVVRGFLVEVTLDLADWRLEGPRLARRHPLEFAGVADKTPGVDTAGKGLWFVVLPFASPRAADLPRDLFDLLEGPEGPRPDILHRIYHTPARARADLSRALIAWARNQPEGAELATAGRP